MIWILIISIYCGAAWSFMLALMAFIPGKRTFVEVIMIALAPIALPPQMHVESLKSLLPEAVAELKSAFVKVTGENPWE